MIKKVIDDFSIEQICDSGQCFRMSKISHPDFGTCVEVIAGGRYLIVCQEGREAYFDCSEREYEEFWKGYFDIDSATDYGKIKASIDPEDSYLNNAAEFGYGIRILNQDPWEMIISFIISQRNNIKRIRGCIARLCEKYGEKKTALNEDGTVKTDADGNEIVYYDFPRPEVLAAVDVSDLKALGVGYRDVYIKKAAEAVMLKEIDVDAISKMNYEESREELLKLYGVGGKVADCICLFALHHTDAFPRDTHIISIVDNEYGGEFPFDKYPGYAGVLQQYMFFYDLK